MIGPSIGPSVFLPLCPPPLPPLPSAVHHSRRHGEQPLLPPSISTHPISPCPFFDALVVHSHTLALSSFHEYVASFPDAERFLSFPFLRGGGGGGGGSRRAQMRLSRQRVRPRRASQTSGPDDVQGDWDEFFHPGSPLRFVISLWLTNPRLRSIIVLGSSGGGQG